jgi:two-component system KDP operon response regulator KdpE
VTRAGEPLRLTKNELALLMLVTNPGKLLGHESCSAEVRGAGYATESNYLGICVRQLRKKLDDHAANPRLILTEPGIGHRWIAGDERS